MKSISLAKSRSHFVLQPSLIQYWPFAMAFHFDQKWLKIVVCCNNSDPIWTDRIRFLLFLGYFHSFFCLQLYNSIVLFLPNGDDLQPRGNLKAKRIVKKCQTTFTYLLCDFYGKLSVKIDSKIYEIVSGVDQDMQLDLGKGRGKSSWGLSGHAFTFLKGGRRWSGMENHLFNKKVGLVKKMLSLLPPKPFFFTANVVNKIKCVKGWEVEVCFHRLLLLLLFLERNVWRAISFFKCD